MRRNGVVVSVAMSKGFEVINCCSFKNLLKKLLRLWKSTLVCLDNVGLFWIAGCSVQKPLPNVVLWTWYKIYYWRPIYVPGKAPKLVQNFLMWCSKAPIHSSPIIVRIHRNKFNSNNSVDHQINCQPMLEHVQMFTFHILFLLDSYTELIIQMKLWDLLNVKFAASCWLRIA